VFWVDLESCYSVRRSGDTVDMLDVLGEGRYRPVGIAVMRMEFTACAEIFVWLTRDTCLCESLSEESTSGTRDGAQDVRLQR